jgi:Zn-finger nucleic acid-binding protein
MNCPVDGTLLTIADRSGIEIDWCPTCRGVWLDRGELDKIIDRTAVEVPGGGRYRDDDDDRWERPERYRDDDRSYRDDDRYRHGRRKKKGGLLGELFDFD